MGAYYLFFGGNDMHKKGEGGSRDGNDREVCIDEMHFDDNGYIKPVKITFEGVKRNKL